MSDDPNMEQSMTDPLLGNLYHAERLKECNATPGAWNEYSPIPPGRRGETPRREKPVCIGVKCIFMTSARQAPCQRHP
jgi:hypothetical protein